MTHYRRNVFLARPTESLGPTTHGVVTYPGFHTAEESRTTFPYAQHKAVPEDLNEELDVLSPGEITIEDYPVVIALDMRGMKRLVDYDAVEFVKPAIEYVEMGESEPHPPPQLVIQWLFLYGTQVLDPSHALLAYAEMQDDPSAFIRSVANGTIKNEALADITGQFRYEQDVPSSRIVKVSYLQPWFPRIFHCLASEEEEDCRLSEALGDAGWSTVDEDDILSGELYEDMSDVYERKPDSSARVEYHGTSYRNLIKAAPDIEWPIPPHPYA